MGISRSYSGGGAFSTGGDTQFVSAAWENTNASARVFPITPVDLSRSFLQLSYSGNANLTEGSIPIATFASAGGVRIQSAGGGGGQRSTYAVYVYQAAPGIIKSVQNVVTSAASATISAVTVAKAMVVPCGYNLSGNSSYTGVSLQLTSTTNVAILTNNTKDVAFQVVEFN